MAAAPPTPNPVKSKKMIITVMLDTVYHEPFLESVEFEDSASVKKHLPKVGQPHPGGGTIVAEKGTLTAVVIAQIKFHHHSDCITFEIGGAQYQICDP